MRKIIGVLMLFALVGAMAYPDAKVVDATLFTLFQFICLWSYIFVMIGFLVNDKT